MSTRVSDAARALAARGGLLLGGLACLALGWALRGALAPADGGDGAAPAATTAAPEVWTCAMHPEIQLPAPGLCPICAMDLVALAEPAPGDGGERQLVLRDDARALLRLETSPVERRSVEARVRMVGKIDYDETRLAELSAWVPGRIDRLYVDYTGVRVKQGDHMVYLYSPKLYADQAALLQAGQAVERLAPNAGPAAAEQTRLTLDAARDRLRRLGLTPLQIAEIEERGTPSEHLTIYAPVGGVVVHRAGQKGMYVEEGSHIYTIADLSHLWVQLDAYESDLPWLHYGQDVEFTTEALPGEVFHGTIAFIAPEIDARTRTAKVRVNLPNEDGRLKPEMFVKAVVRTRVATGGRAMNPDLAGKWICPMHPEVVRDRNEGCDVCGMALVTTESHGYVAAEQPLELPLVIPRSAALVTGNRAVVYVEVPGAAEPTYEGREVVLGPRAGEWYLVRGGLAEGERVVTHGSFKIDSALQILARPSMMNPAAAAEDPLPDAARAQLASLWDEYLALQGALAGDDLAASHAAARAALEAVRAVDSDALAATPRGPEWLPRAASLADALATLSGAPDLAGARAIFAAVSDDVLAVQRAFGLGAGPVYLVHCPMALVDGASWLQDHDEVANPYYGDSMLRCGSVRETLAHGVAGDD
ncbi:MAG: efflux RND transporter periplasmic adaptor subunit [Planctomycetota bacterium]